jgi:hypothetical protein
MGMDNIINNDSLLTLVISLVALVISIIALYYTIVAFLLKSGHKIRCDITTTSTVYCKDKFISNIILENLKDRSTVIFSIYLKLARGNYILIEEFENEPLILRPFEVYQKSYDPIIMYSSGLKRIKIDKLLFDRKVTRKILLSTTDGKYTVKTNTKIWAPTPLFFKNYTTVIVNPIRLSYKDKQYGENIKYLVELKIKEQKDVIIPLKKDDYQIKIFDNFALTTDCLTSKKKLESFLNLQKEQNHISFDELKVIDFEEVILRRFAHYDKNIIELKDRSFFNYNILGRVYTYQKNRKLRKINSTKK